MQLEIRLAAGYDIGDVSQPVELLVADAVVQCLVAPAIVMGLPRQSAAHCSADFPSAA